MLHVCHSAAIHAQRRDVASASSLMTVRLSDIGLIAFRFTFGGADTHDTDVRTRIIY